jgi:hypothetical protein
MSTTTTNLNERAMLVELNIGVWEGRKKDTSTSSKVIHEAHAEADTGAWWTRVVPRSALRPVWAAVAKGRVTHDRLSLPWANNGQRILSAAAYVDYMNTMRGIRAEYQQAVDAFLAEYPDLVTNAEKRLGKLFKKELFPAATALKERFSWRVVVSPLPAANDFRVQLDKDSVEAIRQEISERMQEATQSALKDLWQRLFEVVQKMSSKLKDASAKFKNSLVGNLVDLCELLPKLNLTGDKELEAMRQQIVKQLTTTPADDLRQNKVVRADVATKAAGLLDKIKSFL